MSILSPQQLLDIRSLYAKGVSNTEIAKRVGVHRTTVLRHVGYTRTQDWEVVRNKIERLEEQGIFSRQEQARRLGLHYNTLRAHFGGRTWLAITAEDVTVIRERRAEGESVKQLAFEYRCSVQSIRTVINRKGRFANI